MDDKNKDQSEEKKEITSETLMDKINNVLYSFQKVTTTEKAIFYRLMSTMVDAGISVSKSIAILQKQEKNPVFQKILWRFREELLEWKNLSEAIALYPSVFWEDEVWMIKSWEQIGWLNKILLDLAVQVEKMDSIGRKMKSALIYPAFIIAVVIGVIVIMITSVVPKLLEMFGDKESLPSSTKTLLWVSDFFINYGIYLWVSIFLIVFLITIWKKTPDWKYMFDAIILKTTIVWPITKKIILSKFARVLAWLISSWISIVKSLRIVAEAVWNEVYKQRILLLAEDVSGGIKIWESIEWDKLFPEMMVQMIQVWEQTAKIDETVTKVADFYEEQLDNTISTINKLLEPIIIVFLAIVVWWLALAIMQPIMNLSSTIWNI